MQCDSLLNEAMSVWTSIQNDPAIQQVHDALQHKERQFEEIGTVAPTLVLTQLLAHLK